MPTMLLATERSDRSQYNGVAWSNKNPFHFLPIQNRMLENNLSYAECRKTTA